MDPGTGPQQISLQFDPSNGSISGSSGCNRFNGSYQVDGDRLSFGQMLSTMMACVEGMELEQQILQSLARVKSFRVDGNQLMLLDDLPIGLSRNYGLTGLPLHQRLLFLFPANQGHSPDRLQDSMNFGRVIW